MRILRDSMQRMRSKGICVRWIHLHSYQKMGVLDEISQESEFYLQLEWKKTLSLGKVQAMNILILALLDIRSRLRKNCPRLFPLKSRIINAMYTVVPGQVQIMNSWDQTSFLLFSPYILKLHLCKKREQLITHPQQKLQQFSLEYLQKRSFHRHLRINSFSKWIKMLIIPMIIFIGYIL